MSATDELRRMLTDAGVKYFGVDECTTYWDGTLDGTKWGLWRAFEYDGLLHLMFSDDGDFVTPQEAITATVGRGTCEADETETIKCWVKCKDEPSTEHMELIHVMECTECGHTYEHVNGDYEFCPRCGRKREDVSE